MPAAPAQLDEKRLAFAKECIRLYGNQIPVPAQIAILAQRVALGMSPYEAKLAAGGAYYKVEADAKVWPPNSDPEQVMARQSIQPDDSKIWMSFQTATQFPGEGEQRFSVYFERGRVVQIKKLTEGEK